MPLPLLRGWPVAPSLAYSVCGGWRHLSESSWQQLHPRVLGTLLAAGFTGEFSSGPEFTSPLLALAAKLGNGFIQPWVMCSISSFNRLGHPKAVGLPISGFSKSVPCVSLHLPNFTTIQSPHISNFSSPDFSLLCMQPPGRCAGVLGVNGTRS